MLNEVSESHLLRRVVLDTNTVMALWHFRDPTLARLRAACEAGEIEPFLRPDCREELRRVLGYAQFKIEAQKQASLLAGYEALCTMLVQGEPNPSLPRCRDGDDQKFLELAVQAEVGTLLTRDKALLRLARHRVLRERLRILTPEKAEIELAEAVNEKEQA